MNEPKFCNDCPIEEHTGLRVYCSKCANKKISKLDKFHVGFSVREDDEEIEKEIKEDKIRETANEIADGERDTVEGYENHIGKDTFETREEPKDELKEMLE